MVLACLRLRRLTVGDFSGILRADWWWCRKPSSRAKRSISRASKRWSPLTVKATVVPHVDQAQSL